MTTMREVAIEAGCSVATVSRALHGGARVDDVTRERVREAARKLGYQGKQRVGRDGLGGSTRTIGLLIPTLEKFNYTLSMSLMQRVLAQSDYRLLVCCHDEDPESERELLRSLVDHRVDAIVHVPSGKDGAATLLGEELQVPIVEFYRRSQDPNVEAVVADDRLGSYELVRYLVEFGHRRIALVSDDSGHSTSSLRAEGFSRAVADSDLELRDCPMLFRPQDETTLGRDWGHRSLQEILEIAPEHRPTAILCTSTHVSLGVVEECRRMGIDVPGEMSIVVYSSAEWLDVCDPPLTRYQNPLREMGLMAAQMVLNRLDLSSAAELEPSNVRFSGKLVIRDSVAVPKGSSVLAPN